MLGSCTGFVVAAVQQIFTRWRVSLRSNLNDPIQPSTLDTRNPQTSEFNLSVTQSSLVGTLPRSQSSNMAGHRKEGLLWELLPGLYWASSPDLWPA